MSSFTYYTDYNVCVCNIRFVTLTSTKRKIPKVLIILNDMDNHDYHLIWQVFKTIPYVPVCVLELVYVCVCACVHTDMFDVCM